MDLLELRSADAPLEATVVPGANMIVASLRAEGTELLGQRRGLAAYVGSGSSFGIPLLHPWANRLEALAYDDVGLDPARSPLKLDGNGLPMHGLLTASPAWEVTGSHDAGVEARFRFDSPELLAAFPYPHELTLTIALAGSELSVTTRLYATGAVPVPISFGWHPYVTLPGTPRSDWRLELPLAERALLDGQGIPTGATEPVAYAEGEPLADRAFDDLYLGVPDGACLAAESSDRRVEVRFESGYPVAQVYAPPGEDFICFEPMTAPTNALASGTGLRRAAPGEEFRARFSVRVERR